MSQTTTPSGAACAHNWHDWKPGTAWCNRCQMMSARGNEGVPISGADVDVVAVLREHAALAAENKAVLRLAEKWERIGLEHGVRQFTGNDHLLFANELRVALARTPANGDSA